MDKIKCPLIGNISDDECFDINMVIDDLAPERTMPKEVLEIKNYKDICKKCTHHNKG